MSASSRSSQVPASPTGAIFIEDGLEGTPEHWVVMVARQALAGTPIEVPGLPDVAGTCYVGIDPSEPVTAQRAIADNLRLGACLVFFGVSRDVQVEMALGRSPSPELYAGYGRSDLWTLLAPQIQGLQGTPYPQLRQWIADAAARVMHGAAEG
jgi:hypothetical protein